MALLNKGLAEQLSVRKGVTLDDVADCPHSVRIAPLSADESLRFMGAADYEDSRHGRFMQTVDMIAASIVDENDKPIFADRDEGRAIVSKWPIKMIHALSDEVTKINGFDVEDAEGN